MNTKVRCKPRNMTSFKQKVKIIKTLKFFVMIQGRKLCQNYTTI